MSFREGKTRVLSSARRGCPWCWTGAGPGEKVHRTCPQGPRPPGSAGGRGCLRGAPAAPLSEAPYCQQSLSSPLSDQGLPLGSSLPHGAPDVDTERGWPLQSTAGSWPSGIFNSPRRYGVGAVVPVVQRRKLRLKEALGSARVTQLEGGGAAGVSEPGDRVLATPSHASVKTLMALHGPVHRGCSVHTY